MGKQCPHCLEYSFDGRELIFLTYFSARACPNCGKLVRNDGLRQLLLFLTIMGAVVLAYSILSLLPEWMLPINLVLVVALMIAAAAIVPKPVKADSREISSTPYDADPHNDKVIVVRGWEEGDLRAIIDGFMAERDSEGPTYQVELHQHANSEYRLAFPQDIHPSEFAALVNYLHYPIEFGISEHAVAAIGRMTLSAAFDGIPEWLIGIKAILYVPENDNDHDVVFVQTESGESYSYSFQDSSWRQVKAARIPAEVNRLKEVL